MARLCPTADDRSRTPVARRHIRTEGRALVEAAVERARSAGCERITLRTYADVPFNAPFYRSCGFVELESTSGPERERARQEERVGLDRLGRRVSMVRHLGAARD